MKSLSISQSLNSFNTALVITFVTICNEVSSVEGSLSAMDIPAPAAAPMDAALALLDNLEGLSTEQKKSIFPVLGKLLNNIVENPLEDKYRAINKSNKKIQATFCNQYGQVTTSL